MLSFKSEHARHTCTHQIPSLGSAFPRVRRTRRAPSIGSDLRLLPGHRLALRRVHLAVDVVVLSVDDLVLAEAGEAAGAAHKGEVAADAVAADRLAAVALRAAASDLGQAARRLAVDDDRRLAEHVEHGDARRSENGADRVVARAVLEGHRRVAADAEDGEREEARHLDVMPFQR